MRKLKGSHDSVQEIIPIVISWKPEIQFFSNIKRNVIRYYTIDSNYCVPAHQNECKMVLKQLETFYYP